MRQIHVARFNLRAHRTGARFFSAFWIDCNQTADLVLQCCDHGRAIRLVLDELGVRLLPFIRQLPDGIQRLREIEPGFHLVQQKLVRALLAPDLSDDEVARVDVFEGHVPGLHLFLEMVGQINGGNDLKLTVGQAHADRRK